MDFNVKQDEARDFWDREAEAFDHIYGRDGQVRGLLNRLFRKDMEGRFRFVLAHAFEAANPKILEIGCGSGVYTEAFLRRGAHVTGVDISSRMLEITQRRLSEFMGRYALLEGDFTKMSFDRAFDVVTAVGVFDYIAEPGPFLKKMTLCTRSLAIATFPRSRTWRAAVRSWRLRLKGCPVYFYDRETIQGLAAECGMTIRRHEVIGQLHCLVMEPS